MWFRDIRVFLESLHFLPRTPKDYETVDQKFSQLKIGWSKTGVFNAWPAEPFAVARRLF
jgi:hypothetical protein